VQAALLSVKLAHLDEELAQRARVVSHYDGLLTAVAGVETFDTPAGATSAHHLMVVKVPDRDRVLKELQAAGVGAGVHYPTPVHWQPAWRSLNLPHGEFAEAEALAQSVLSLPLYAQMSPGQVERCVDALAQAVGR
jgi:dTDP-4-amino-4,6-dideoxygalactose transaminase